MKLLPCVVMLVTILSFSNANAQEVEADHGADSHSAAHAADAHDAGHEHAHIGAEGVIGDPSSIRTDLAIWTFVVFLILLAILWKFAWGPIVTALDSREHGIANDIAGAQRANEDAKALLAQYERKLASAQDEVRAIIEEARRDAEHTQQQILAKARADADIELSRARREIDTATSQALREIAHKSTDLAVELAGKIVGAQLSAGDHSRLIQDAIGRFPQSAAGRN